MHTEAREEHRWLDRFVGEWESTWEEPGADGAPPTRHTGRETVRRHGDFWVVGEGTHEVNGVRHTNLLALGFDPDRERWVGTFVASAMPQLWVYDGTREGDALVLECDGPRFDGRPGIARYRDVYALEGDARRSLSSSVRDDATGEWQHFMTMTYTRTG